MMYYELCMCGADDCFRCHPERVPMWDDCSIKEVLPLDDTVYCAACLVTPVESLDTAYCDHCIEDIVVWLERSNMDYLATLQQRYEDHQYSQHANGNM